VASLLLRCIVAAAAAGSGGYLAAGALDERPAIRLVVNAQKYDWGSTEIRVRKGERVTLALTTTDFVHGFSIPDFGVRVDLVPGRTVEVVFAADRTGRFAFLCDNFCGEGHDRMSGFLVVTDP
jgi:cytochrome c oxidase subunit II